ncbi:MAG: GNAT family N-acetyltransferase, partial [Planctomycetota bacterium]
MPDPTYRLEKLELPRDRETLLKFHDLYDKEYKFDRKREDRDRFFKYLKEHSDIYHCLVLWKGDEPVAYVWGYDRLSTSSCDIVFMLDIVYVSPDHRGKGLGKKMIVHLIEYARDYGAARIDLLADTTNKVAQNLYKGFGFMGRTRFQMHRFIKEQESLTRYFDEKVAEEAA